MGALKAIPYPQYGSLKSSTQLLMCDSYHLSITRCFKTATSIPMGGVDTDNLLSRLSTDAVCLVVVDQFRNCGRL